MSKYRLVTSLVVLIIFASVSLGIALTYSGGSGTASPTSRQSNTVSPSAQTKIFKVMGIVTQITRDTLYLENNKKYDLRNVKVTYNKGKKISEKKKTAEMFFVNDVLKEVVIY